MGRDVWTVRKGRMKGSREHRVPLSARALAVLEELEIGLGATIVEKWAN